EVREGRIASFATYMSGETYALLRQHSILARTLPAEEPPLDEAAFTRGVRHAQATGSLLHSAFSARTLALFDRMPAEALASYLSGLVIGEELRARGRADTAVVLVGSPALCTRYRLALQATAREARSLGSEATWRGLWAIAQTLEPT
ncbi:MAG TPA: 2-dehydro-3-deoxygalactonokinase, partial [Ramlibacter sp.]|nr:2-dehydro-3-deoxygalactonokinase [Ramlibacter sp.]